MIFFRNADQIARLGLTFLFAIVLAGTRTLGQGSPSDKPQTETIRGTVINSVTQAPVPRALVLTPDNTVAVLTDNEGHFEISVPQQDTNNGIIGSYFGSAPRLYALRGQSFFLTARKPGFLDDMAGQGPKAAPSSSDELVIPLMPEAIIKGRITLDSGEAPVGIMVQLFSRQVVDGLPRWTQGAMARANSAGEFRFAELQPGSYKLVTREYMDNDPVTNTPGSQQYGYPPVYLAGAPDFSASSTIELTAGQEFEADLSLVRQAYYPVRIPVANAQGMAGLNVFVRGQRGPGYDLGYNPTEQRVEGLLPNGNYMVEASTFGQNAMNGSVDARVSGAPLNGPAVALVPNSSIPLEVKEEFSDTTWSGSMTVTVNDKRSFAVHGPRIYLQASLESADEFAQQQFGSIRPPTGPNDDGLVLESVIPGRYWLRLHTGRGYVASATQGPTDLLHQPLTVGSGPAAPIEITVRDDFAELDGTVMPVAQSAPSGEASGDPHVWIYCVPLPESAGAFTEFGVSGDGKFVSPQMAPGDYRILAFYSSHPQLPYRDPEAMKAYESKGTVVHLGAGQKATVQIQTVLE